MIVVRGFGCVSVVMKEEKKLNKKQNTVNDHLFGSFERIQNELMCDDERLIMLYFKLVSWVVLHLVQL